MRKLSIFSLVIVSFVFLSSCSQIKQSLYRLGFRNYKTIYTEDLKAHTKSYTLYRDFSTAAKVKVTHFDQKLFKDYIRGIIRDTHLICKSTTSTQKTPFGMFICRPVGKS